MICFAEAEAFGLPEVVDTTTTRDNGVVHESLRLLVHAHREPVIIHVDFARPEAMSEATPFLLFHPGGRGRSATDYVIWSARAHGTATMSYDWPGRHRSPPLHVIQDDIDPFHVRTADPRESYFYAVTNAASGVYRHWARLGHGHLRVLSGSSWGGVITLLTAATYRDHDLAYAEFGCGGFSPDFGKRSYWDFWRESSPQGVSDNWRAAFDPIDFAGDIHCPVVMATSSNDKFFSLDMFEATFARLTGPKAMLVVPNTDHNMRSLNSQLNLMTAAATRAPSRDFSWLACPDAATVAANGTDYRSRTQWLAVSRGRNAIARHWHAAPLADTADLDSGRTRFTQTHRPFVRHRDRLVSFVTYTREAFGRDFSFSTPLVTTAVADLPNAPPRVASIDLKPGPTAAFEDRIAYRAPENLRESADVVRFPGAPQEWRAVISGVFAPVAMDDEASFVEIAIEIVEPMATLHFALLADPEQASERAWGIDLGTGGLPAGAVIRQTFRAADLPFVDVYRDGTRERGIGTTRQPVPFDRPAISACCFWAPALVAGAIRIVTLAWHFGDPFKLTTSAEARRHLAAATIGTRQTKEEVEARLRRHEPWRYRLLFSNGADTANLARMEPWVDNIHEKAAFLWPWMVNALKPGYSVLDVGSGIGHHRFSFRALGCGAYTGIEYSTRNVNVCNEIIACSGGVAHGDRIIHGDAASTDPGGPYDLVLCLAVLNNLADPEGALAMMRRAMAPGAVLVMENLVVETPQPDPLKALTPQGYRGDISLCWIPTLPGLEALLARHAFTDIRHRFTWRKPAAIGEGMAKVWTTASARP